MIEILETPPAQAPTEQKPEKLLQDPSALEQWLDSLPAQAICGHAHCSVSCPLAQYLRACYPQALLITVGNEYYHVGTTGRGVLPSWAARFVRWVDRHAGRQEITAGAARAALEALR